MKNKKEIQAKIKEYEKAKDECIETEEHQDLGNIEGWIEALNWILDKKYIGNY